MMLFSAKAMELLILALVVVRVQAFPSSHDSLAGLSREDLDLYIRATPLASTGALPPPGAISDTSAKLVNDATHPYIAPKPTDQRGPCPGLNTLANHGYLNRTGVDSPQNIATAVQEGFNMGSGLAILITWGAFVVDGNQLTNLMSIGGKTSATGAFPPAPAIVGGLNTHGVFEGDASTTRGDFYFGDNHSFNATLFNQLLAAAKKYGDGFYNFTVAAEFRWHRIQDSIARNPTFNFLIPRYFTAYAESVFPLRFFVDGRKSQANPRLDMGSARDFFQANRFPTGFFRRAGAYSSIGNDIVNLIVAHPIQPGANTAKGNYVVSTTDQGLAGGQCGIYNKHIGETVPSLYPPATTAGALRTALKANIVTFYHAAGEGCPQLFPYGE